MVAGIPAEKLKARVASRMTEASLCQRGRSQKGAEEQSKCEQKGTAQWQESLQKYKAVRISPEGRGTQNLLHRVSGTDEGQRRL
jgi:hypothetical protein